MIFMRTKSRLLAPLLLSNGRACGKGLESLLYFHQEAHLSYCLQNIVKCISGGLCSKHASEHDGLDPTDLCTYFSRIIHHGVFLALSTPGRI